MIIRVPKLWLGHYFFHLRQMSEPTHRRDFLTGKAALEKVRGQIEIPDVRPVPVGGPTIRLSTRAMACDFSVIMNPGSPDHVPQISTALDRVTQLEQQLSVYIPESEVSQLNRLAFEQPRDVESDLFGLLVESKKLYEATSHAFDPTAGALIALWRRCRASGRIPTQVEIDSCLEYVGMDKVELAADGLTAKFAHPSLEVNFGAIGKGYALDQADTILQQSDLDSWLLHGGHSSLLGRGNHNQQGGWPVGIGNPLFTQQRLGTVLLCDAALGTSGSNIQHFHHQGKRYGHILDPRTGWPVDQLLSVTVVAPTAAEADALSTAFFVMGVEKTRECCDNLVGVGAILIPRPQRGRRVSPILVGIPEEIVFWNADQIDGSN